MSRKYDMRHPWWKMANPIRKKTAGNLFGAPVRVVIAAALFLAGGCEDDAGGRQAISGSVTVKGKPVEMGMIEFIPVAGASMDGTYIKSGAVIENGKYEIPKKKGLVPGRYKVTMSAPDKHNKMGGDELPGPTSSRTSKDLIPPEFNLKSKLEVEVKKGPNNFDFAVP
jgi:hypothetical protein